jgi:GTPase Era involved in 16S rRNA processing
MKSILNTFDSTILLNKPLIIIANKVDNFASQVDMENKLNEFKENEAIKNELVIPISAEKKINLIKFMKILRHFYEKFNKN